MTHNQQTSGDDKGWVIDMEFNMCTCIDKHDI
jgi:hypothetical protein